MPLTTETVDLQAEYDRLTEEMERFADRQASEPVGSEAAAQASQHGQRMERLRSGVAWAMQAHDDPDVPFWTEAVEVVTLSALTNGERHRVRDTADETGAKLSDCYVAAGTYDAPYLAHDPEAIAEEAFRETVQHVVDAHPAFVDWAESRISDISRVGGDTGKSYRTLVLEKRSQRASPTENG